ncbi:MAG TPA: flagellar hook capping FlgD N-terminal domain-containing protein, partial [Stellaceae bacterium]|nr:flagellar hook capping FlgD N-terminal domain-containing protein [Stellaceae bacterium]
MVAASMMPATVTTLPAGGTLPKAPAKTTGPGTTLNQNDFLPLLTTQLSHQDPLNAQSPSDFAAELAQFTTASGVQNLNAT